MNDIRMTEIMNLIDVRTSNRLQGSKQKLNECNMIYTIPDTFTSTMSYKYCKIDIMFIYD